MEKEIELTSANTMLDFGRARVALLKVYLDDQLIDVKHWLPFHCLVPSEVACGKHRLKVEVYSSNRNLLGPHHHEQGELHSVGPSSFSGEWSWTDKTSEAVQTTPAERLQNFWREDYCFVTFGL